MALAPKFAGQKFAATNAPTLHTLELYRPYQSLFSSNRLYLCSMTLTWTVDYVCPFSAKMFNTVYTSVFPLIEKKYASKVQILFRQQIQPWHPSSTLVHEAGVAVLKLQPSKFWDFSKVRSGNSEVWNDAKPEIVGLIRWCKVILWCEHCQWNSQQELWASCQTWSQGRPQWEGDVRFAVYFGQAG